MSEYTFSLIKKCKLYSIHYDLFLRAEDSFSKLSVLLLSPHLLVYRFGSKEPACLPPAAGLLAAISGFPAVLPASSDLADDMGEGPSQLLPLGVDCPVNGPAGCLCVAQTSTCSKTVFFTAGDGTTSNAGGKVPACVFSVMQNA